MAHYNKRSGYMQQGRRVNGRLVTKQLHRVIWEEAYGEIPPNHHIHHKNGVKTDNRLENLELMSQFDHSMHHLPVRSWEPRHKRKGNGKQYRSGWRRLPCDVVVAILTDWSAGGSLIAIRRKLGVHDDLLKRVIVDFDARNRSYDPDAWVAKWESWRAEEPPKPKRKRGRPPVAVSDEQLAKIISMRADGLQWRRVAGAVGLSHNVARRAFYGSRAAQTGFAGCSSP
jgi:hypothetical protein